MASSFCFHPSVSDDLSAATRWFDDISVELGNRFRRAVNSRFDAVELRPESFGCVRDELRAARIDGFPYLVVFEYDGSVTTVLGIFHAAADPEKWNRRRQ